MSAYRARGRRRLGRVGAHRLVLREGGSSGVFYRRTTAAPADGEGPLVPLYQADQVPTAHVSVAALPDGGALVAYDVGMGGAGARVVQVARVTPDGHRAALAMVPASDGGGHPPLAVTGRSTAALAYPVTAGDARSVRAARIRLAD